MIKFIKKYLYKIKIEKKIRYIYKFVRGKIPNKTIDPELDKMGKDIEICLKKKMIENKISYEKFSAIMSGLYYHNNINQDLTDGLMDNLKSKEPNIEETQNVVCEAIERSNADVR